MSKIYTRRGDDGSTGLFGGPRVRKDDLRVGAYGEVDELNSALGVAREELLEPAQKDLLAIVDALQSELFTLGSELATPQADKAPREVPRIRAEMVARMEKDIDRLTGELPEMRQFILPGGSPSCSANPNPAPRPKPIASDKARPLCASAAASVPEPQWTAFLCG